MLSFELLDVFLLIGIVQGVFLAFSLQRVKNTNKSTNRVLGSLLILATIMLMGRLLYFRLPTSWPLQLSLLPDVIIFVFGPQAYKFVRKLCFSDDSGYKLSKIHFVPAVFQFVVFLFFMQFSNTEFRGFWNDGTLMLPFAIIEGTAIVLNLFYWYLGLRVLWTYEREEKNIISYKQGLRTFLRFFLFSLLLFFIVWLYSYLRTYLMTSFGVYANYNAVWIIIPMFIYVITYYAIRQPEFFRVSINTSNRQESKVRLSEKEVGVLNDKLDRLLTIEKIYLNPELTLSELALKLQSTTHDVSWYLNNIHNSNFYDFVNQQRVDDFLRRLEQGQAEKLTLLAIAFDVGFKSKSTFNKAFKKATNQTPTTYLKMLQISVNPQK